MGIAKDARNGITSACAESTSQRAVRPVDARNHLRLRGEHAAALVLGPSAMESPPLARRAPRPPHEHPAPQGITSACAESTFAPSGVVRAARNHLRLRGEHRGDHHSRMPFEESPPLARRARDGGFRAFLGHGITSACAESTTRADCTRPAYRNHLRLRGEHEMSNVMNSGTRESPPLARRAHVRVRRLDFGQGITSACAESTRS